MKKMMMLTSTAYMSERFNRNNILILENMGYEVHVVANFEDGNPTTAEVLEEFKRWVESHHGKCIHVPIVAKILGVHSNYRALRECIELIGRYEYDFIHCHTPFGGVIGRIAAKISGTKIIYTAHGFHFYSGAPLKNWLIYYPIEKILSRWTDVLLVITKEDYDRAKRKFFMKKIIYIPGIGIDIKKIEEMSSKKENVRLELRIGSDDIMLLSVGELNKNKNHKVIIDALFDMKKKNVCYCIAGIGKLEQQLREYVSEKGMENVVHFLGYRTDIVQLNNAADIFCFPSRREGVSVALMEAMVCQSGVICSSIRGNVDLIDDDVNGYCFTTYEELKIKLAELIDNSSKRKIFGEKAYEKVKRFSNEKVDSEMCKIYASM